MAKCQFCGKGVAFGITVSHSHIRTNRTFKPNVKRVKALVDGKEETMYTKVDMFDNLPLIPYDLLVEYLGYEYNRTETEINISTEIK